MHIIIYTIKEKTEGGKEKMKSKEKIRRKGQMQNERRNNANRTCNHNHRINNISYGNDSNVNRPKWIIKQSGRSPNSK